jgi:hypothetical protein
MDPEDNQNTMEKVGKEELLKTLQRFEKDNISGQKVARA